jgi:hypothetical protein
LLKVQAQLCLCETKKRIQPSTPIKTNRKIKTNNMASSSKAKTNKSVSILDVNPKGDMKKAALKTFAEVGISVIGGGVAGAVIGKPSFLIGLVLAGVGYYKGVSWLAPLGLGMMSKLGYLLRHI